MICQNLHLLGRGRSGYETGEDHPIRRNAFDELEKFIPTMFCILHNWHEKLCFSGIFFKRALFWCQEPIRNGLLLMSVLWWINFFDGQSCLYLSGFKFALACYQGKFNSMFMYSISSRRAGKEDEDADEDADGEGRGYGQGRTKKQTGTRTGTKTRTRIRMRILRWA